MDIEALDEKDDLFNSNCADSNLESNFRDVIANSSMFEVYSFISTTHGCEPTIPRAFAEACKDPQWEAAIDREYNALVRRNTW